MVLAPEAQILILIGIILAVAYLGIFPRLEKKTINKLMGIDLALNVLALIVAGAWFWGTGVTFTLVFYETNWAIFTIVCFALLEIPLFLNFAKKHGIRLDGRDDDD
jgi:NADH:ubiquinone oxidoreductase subunit K